jgi:hypothetical protein
LLAVNTIEQTNAGGHIMGFDIIGIKPVNDARRGFYRNIQAWTPLWRFICQNCDDILTAQQMEEGFANDGIRISARQTKLIVERLENIINSKYSIGANKAKTTLKEAASSSLQEVQKVLGVNSSPSSQDLRSDLIEFLEFARHSGGFRIW